MLAVGWVGACTFPDYTFQNPVGSGGLGGIGTTSDLTTTTTGTITSTGTSSSDAGSSQTTTNTTTSAGGSSGGDGAGGDGNLAGSAGEGAEGGTDSGGSAGLGGGGGSTSIGGGGGASGTGGTAGAGGSGLGPCGNDAQCLSGQCDDGWCRHAHCGNEVSDGLETDIDCGGPDCRPCGYNQGCMGAADCATARCSNDGRCEPTLVVNCACSPSGSCNLTPQSTRVEMQLLNVGPARIEFDDLTFRYFFSSEGSGSDQVRCDQLNFEGATCMALFTGDVLDTGFDDVTATQEVAFHLSGGALDPNENTGSILFTIQGNGPYQRANDYSFEGTPAGPNMARCDKIVVMNADDVPIWGVLPK